MKYKKEKSMLKIEHLSKNYGNKKAVDDLKRITIGLTGTPDVRITSICFWIMLLTRRKQKKSY